MSPEPTPGADEQLRFWNRAALVLVAATLAYNIVEASVALFFGTSAESVALVGFGFDSVIESAAAVVVLWRLFVQARGGDAEKVEATEGTVHRFVGVTFVLLILFVAASAGWTLYSGRPTEETRAGIVLAIASVMVMPLIAWGKFRAADALDSRALRAEAKETLACVWLSGTLLIGLGATVLWGWWWADPVAALAMIPWLAMEAREAFEDEDEDDDD